MINFFEDGHFMIPYGKQNISDEDIQAVVDVLRSDYLTQGPMVPEFEKKVASYCGVKYAVAVNSATSALHIACLSLDVGAGDIVWTSPITFVASANCAIYCGAQVDFVDIDPLTYNMSIDSLVKKLEKAKKSGTLPKVVIPVHLAGQSCDMKAIHQLSEQYGFKIIEDASHAIGGSYHDTKIGSCTYSDITVFSFHPVKIITTGEGGMALTNNQSLVKRMARLRSHGITRYPEEMTHIPDGPWYYQQIELGFNYRMTEIQAALGFSQMSRLDSFVSERHEVAKRYDQLLSNSGIKLPWQDSQSVSAFHLYVVRIPVDHASLNRNAAFDNLRIGGVGVNLHYIPVYKQPYYQAIGFDERDFSESERYYEEAISLPMYPGLELIEQKEVVHLLTGSAGYQTIF
ncbi:UDP-4-amino-4,6-dideoxy-N-acetyl-beta-L-altrosamine transaminase [Polynucleobacter sp. UK-Kesae-W10]|uniref:UDP-4-amino-4, 6-dideoxy-N-acetyl-beta-L-altrosamine transaminase n=1 Tax=Polynucleobacter sp. UK-Kesae-W10 TaxID=1819738 RepID=UPI00351D0065